MRIPAPAPLVVALLVLQAGCGLIARKPTAPPRATQVTPFSVGVPGGAWPGGWQNAAVTKLREPSHYALVRDGGTTVLEGIAAGSASGLVQRLDIDPNERPMLVWRWKLIQPVDGADTTRRSGEDAPLRIMVSFDGDVQKLPFNERLFFDQAKAVWGVDVPYATLEYVWGSGAAVGTVVVNSYTSRVRIVLVESGPEPSRQWVTEARDVVADFRRAFGEEPGRITAIAIYTDADATGAQSQGRYGDIAFLPRDRTPFEQRVAEPDLRIHPVSDP